MKLTHMQLQILAIISRDRRKDGWYYEGSGAMRKELSSYAKTTIQENLLWLIENGLLETPELIDRRRKVIPVKQTKLGYETRLAAFGELFPDIKSVLLSKR